MTVTTLPIGEHPEYDGIVTTHDAINRAGVTYRQLDFWYRQGHISPLPRPPYATSGTPLYYARSEVAVLVLMAQLVRDGLSARHAAEHARRLLDTGHTRIAGITVHLPEDA